MTIETRTAIATAIRQYNQGLINADMFYHAIAEACMR
jgi:hypothetical protein